MNFGGGGGLADACAPQWLDMLTELLTHIANHPNVSHNYIRSNILPAIKYIHANDFARACQKVYKDENSPFYFNGVPNDQLAFTCAAKLARACSPMEDRVKHPLLLMAIQKFNDTHSMVQPKDLIDSDIPIVRAQMIRSLWEWKEAVKKPIPRDAISRRLPGLDYRAINYRLTTETAKPPERSMLGKMFFDIIRNIENSVQQVIQLSSIQNKNTNNDTKSIASTFHGWFKRLRPKKREKMNQKKKHSDFDNEGESKKNIVSREILSSIIIKNARNDVDELCYSIEVSLKLISKHVPLVYHVVENERLSKCIGSCVNQPFGVMPSSLIREGLAVIVEMCYLMNREMNMKAKKNRHYVKNENKIKAIQCMVGATVKHLINKNNENHIIFAEEDDDDQDTSQDTTQVNDDDDTCSIVSVNKTVKNATATLKRENIVHRRLALSVITASGEYGLLRVHEACALLLDEDTSVSLAALECVQKMASIDPKVPCTVLCSMLKELVQEEQGYKTDNGDGHRNSDEDGKCLSGAVTILRAMSKLKSIAAEHSSKDLINLITKNYKYDNNKNNDKNDENNSSRTPETKDNNEKITTSSINTNELRLVAVNTLISICSEEVLNVGFQAPLISVFELILTQKNEISTIRSTVLSSLSTLLGPAAIRYSKYFVRSLIDKDPETRRVALVGTLNLWYVS